MKSMRLTRLYIVLIVSFTAGPCIPGALASDATTVADGVYSGEQAARGEDLFNANCAECHDTAFFEQSLGNRVNEPVAYLFQEILVTMPLTAPGLLQESQYEDIFAYMLQLVGFAAGESDLTFSSGEMDHIVLRPPD